MFITGIDCKKNQIICRIYVPERPLSPNTGKRNVPREPYSLNNDTDFDTIINTSMNKYTGRPHVSSYVNNSVTATICKTKSTDHIVCNSSDDTTVMELTACIGRETERFNKWSTETTRVFGTQNTSKMDLTSGHDIGINVHVRNANDHVFASQLQSALNTVAEIENKTKVFGGDDDTADMEFTACLTSNLAQLKCGVTGESPNPEDMNCKSSLVQSCATPLDTTKRIDADMEITLCNINTKSQPNSTSPLPMVDSQAFLKKLTCGNISSSQNNTCNRLDVEGNEDGIASFKIDSQAFLNKLKGGSSAKESNIQDTDVPTRERKTTEGSEDMEFTACLNQISSDMCHEELVSTQPSDQKILGTKPVNISAAQVLVADISNKKASEHVALNSEQTHIFHPEEENMEFTACISGTLKEASHVEEQTSPEADKTKVFSSEENMEFTACFGGSLKSNASLSEDVSISGDRTKIFDSVEKDNMEFTTCIDTVARYTTVPDKDGPNLNENAMIFESDRRIEGVQVLAGKLSTEETSNGFDNGREAGSTAIPEEHSKGLKPRKRAHPHSDANTVPSLTEHSPIIDERTGLDSNETNTECDENSEDMKTSKEIESDLPSPVPEEVTGLKGLMNKVKKARKSIGSGETTCVFTAEMTLAQMDLTTCIGGNDLYGSSEKSPVKQKKDIQVRIFFLHISR